MILKKIFEFSAAHNLINYNGNCENLHGHTYKLEVSVEGPVKDDGMVMDFHLLKKIVKELIIDKVDHTYLNDFLPQPTAELTVIWIWDLLEPELKRHGVKLYELALWESPTSVVIYRGEK